jgi:hypothetical protein
MIYTDLITVHNHEPHYHGLQEDQWEKRENQGIEARYCNYCGSLHPEDLVRLLKECERAEFADRKYGYPHKIYLDMPNHKMLKFYTKHLIDLKDKETVNTILDLIRKETGVWLQSHLEELDAN